jgi:glycyl-tRNA synthetase beta chain
MQLLLELFSEEIPARMQSRAAADLAGLVAEGLAKQGLSFAAPQSFATPRRLTLVIEDLPQATPDINEERRGPRIGAPEAALEGFLKGAGLTLDQCEQRDTGKGVFYFAVISKAGRPIAEVVKEVVEQVLAAFPWPKSMRWGTETVRWVRPLQSILCLLGGKVVPVRFGSVTAGNETRGHRFLAPAAFAVTDAADYKAKLAEAKVVLDPDERRHAILAAARKAAAKEGLVLREDEGLLAEVAGLVEWPVILTGSFDEAFMAVPDEALITSMRAHQKYFSLLRADGSLSNRFLVVANLRDGKDGAVIAGNQRVLRARLSDAKFFWDSDRKQRLETRVAKLEERLFYAGLGSVKDKALRIAELSALIARKIGADAARAERAGLLAKADLSSEMVGEFPELQGVMGRYYALADGEGEDIADAIGAHYAPQGPNDSCPRGGLAVAVALADKIDSLAGFFAIGEKPTGSKDPFALRRAALGVIRLILENGLRLSLKELLAAAHGFYGNLPGKAEAVADELAAFFADRLKTHLREQGVRHDLITAVFAAEGEDDLVRLLAKVRALENFLASDDGANLLVAYRRAANIVRIESKKDGTDYGAAPLPEAAGQAEELDLDRCLRATRDTRKRVGEDYAAAMTAMAALRRPVDGFFDKVTVNSTDAGERRRRLTLLGNVCAVMNDVADFSAIEG